MADVNTVVPETDGQAFALFDKFPDARRLRSAYDGQRHMGASVGEAYRIAVEVVKQNNAAIAEAKSKTEHLRAGEYVRPDDPTARMWFASICDGGLAVAAVEFYNDLRTKAGYSVGAASGHVMEIANEAKTLEGAVNPDAATMKEFERVFGEDARLVTDGYSVRRIAGQRVAEAYLRTMHKVMLRDAGKPAKPVPTLDSEVMDYIKTAFRPEAVKGALDYYDSIRTYSKWPVGRAFEAVNDVFSEALIGPYPPANYLSKEGYATASYVEVPMTADQYQREAARTLIDEPGEFTKEDMMLIWNAVGLGGEAGEVLELVKKGIFHRHGLDKARMKKELGDVAWYTAAMATKLGFSLSEIFAENIAKLKQRYPGGWSTADSVARVDVKEVGGE